MSAIVVKEMRRLRKRGGRSVAKPCTLAGNDLAATHQGKTQPATECCFPDQTGCRRATCEPPRNDSIAMCVQRKPSARFSAQTRHLVCVALAKRGYAALRLHPF